MPSGQCLRNSIRIDKDSLQIPMPGLAADGSRDAAANTTFSVADAALCRGKQCVGAIRGTSKRIQGRITTRTEVIMRDFFSGVADQ